MNKWKITAIILLIICVIESSIIIWGYMESDRYWDNDLKCSMNICEDGDYTSYYYSPTTGICYCYQDEEIKHEEYIR